MKIHVNGQEKQFHASLTLQSTIEALGLNPLHVIAEVNGRIVKKNDWTLTSLVDGDTLELVSFVGGG